MARNGYKIRSYTSGKGKNSGSEYKNYSLTVPNAIAEALPGDLTFQPRVTDEGILYVPSSNAEEVVDLPQWAKPEA